MTRQRLLKSGRRLTKVFFSKVFTTFYRRVVIVVQPIQTPIPELSARVPIVPGQLASDVVAAYDEFRPSERAKARQRLGSGGEECFVAWHEGRIVHATWVATGRAYVPYLNRDLLLESDQMYLHDAYTLPAYRGCNIAPVMFAYIMQCYLERGFLEFVAVATVEKARKRFYEKYGGKVVGSYSCLRLGRWQTQWQQTMSEAPLPFTKAAGRSWRDAEG